MDIDWTNQLVEQLEWHWREHLRPRLDDLSDDEYLWEPVPGCWSIRPRSEATTPIAAGTGDAIIEYEYPEPVPPPVTTIAWRMGHISIGIFGARAANHFGDGGVDYQTVDWPLTAKGGLELLDHWHDEWFRGIKGLDIEALGRPVGPHEGPFAERPYAELILHINREAIHHGAEIALLRDLYEHQEVLS